MVGGFLLDLLRGRSCGEIPVSAEVLAIASVVEDGAAALRKLYAEGVSYKDFVVWEEEFRWVEKRLAQRKPLNRRVFRQKFPEFEWPGVPVESIEDLCQELRDERAFEEVSGIIGGIAENLQRDNAVELAVQAREQLAVVSRSFLPMSDVDLDDWEDAIEEARQGMILARQGITQGIPTGHAHLDHHLGGLMPGQMIQVLGRSGEGKSYMLVSLGWSAKKHNFKAAIFSPEHSKHEVRCRYHTLASADKGVQKAVGLERSFRNRALLFKRGFNLKSYERFCRYLKEELPGRLYLLSGTHRPEQMTVGYIEDRIVELELDLVIIDPLYLLRPVRLSQGGNEYQEEAWTAEAVHRLSERYNIPIVFSSQAHMDKKEDAPHKSDSFGSKSKVHLADYVLGIKHLSEENLLKVRSSKSRFGAGFRYDLAFYANTGVIKELTPLIGSYYNGRDEEAEDEELKEMIAAATAQELRDIGVAESEEEAHHLAQTAKKGKAAV